MVIKQTLAVIVFCFFRCEGAMVVQAEPLEVNDRPIIGILAQEQAYHLNNLFIEENYTSYIAASYVKDVESSGARVVPIMIGKSREYYRDLLGKINGVLLPGGATYFNQTDGYADAGEHIYNIAIELNDYGDYFPVFGTCLGFELLVILASGRESNNRENCKAFGNCPVTFTRDFRTSKMFRDIDNITASILENENVTINAHGFCVLDENLQRYNLTKDWQTTSHSIDSNGLRYIASIEHKRYPFYGVQFHPEKSPFEWSSTKYYTHTHNAVKVNRYFMDFFVQECRKNTHKFRSEEEENKYLIYKYKPTFTGEHGSQFTQCYFFDPRGTVSK